MKERIIYHGSNVTVSVPKVLIHGFYKNFGYGFYCTELEKQAKRWALVKKKNQIVNVYTYMITDDLKILKFDKLTEEWLYFVVDCRSGKDHDFDIVEGSMADDTIWDYIEDYLRGTITREVFWVLAKFKYLTEHISPLVKLKTTDELSKRFDYLIYSIALGYLQSKNVQTPINIVVQTAELLSGKYTIPQVKAKKKIIERVQEESFWEETNVVELDHVRLAMRELLQYLDKGKRKIYYTDFTDSIIDVVEGEPIFDSGDLKNYRKKVEFYLKEHDDNLAVYKLRNNKRLSEWTSLSVLQEVLQLCSKKIW